MSPGDLRAPTILCRPAGANLISVHSRGLHPRLYSDALRADHVSAYLPPFRGGLGWGSSTGVDTPAYTLTPFGLVMSLHISLPLGKITKKAFAFIFDITVYQSICYDYEGKNFAFIISRFFGISAAECADWV